MMKYILFDLDGTLTDPKIGITSCVQYALKHFGIEEPDLDKLEPFIGPPLKGSFMEYYGFTEEQAEEAIAKYRERFQDVGIFENKVYRGIPRLLKDLKANGRKLAVASSKPTVFVERILDHFRIRQYFDVVVGSELDGSRVDKNEIIQETLHRLFGEEQFDRSELIMVGDRKYDIQGAKSWFIRSIGVTYGYGTREELKEAGADYIAADIRQLEEILLKEELRVRKEAPFRKLWLIILPFLTFLIIRQVSVYLGYMALGALCPLAPGTRENLFFRMGAEEAVSLTDMGVNLLSAFSFLVSGIVFWYLNREFLKKLQLQAKRAYPGREPFLNYILLIVSAVGISLGLNILLNITGFTGLSPSYEAVSESQYSVAVPLGILIYGILAPVSEELVFRGVLYQRLRRMYNPMAGILVSSLLFAIYHGNIVQGLFAFLMGILIARLYEDFGYLYIAVILHSLMNLVSYGLTLSGQYSGALCHWYVCAPVLLAGLGSFLLLYYRKHTFYRSAKITH